MHSKPEQRNQLAAVAVFDLVTGKLLHLKQGGRYMIGNLDFVLGTGL